MKSLLTIILSLSLFQNVAFARHISGAVKDAENKPIENASVVLLNAKDSSVIKLGAANKNGKYDFENINAGHYIIKATAVGFTPAFSPSFEYKGDDPGRCRPALRKICHPTCRSNCYRTKTAY